MTIKTYHVALKAASNPESWNLCTQFALRSLKCEEENLWTFEP